MILLSLVAGLTVYAQDPTATPTPTPLPTATPIPPTATALPTATPIPLAPFVNPQAARPDGSVVHVVQFGDTLDAILFGYAGIGIVLTTEDLMRFNSWEYKPQFIYVGDEIIILPAGSVDPSTGQLLVTEAQLDTFSPSGQAPAAAATTAPDATVDPAAGATQAPSTGSVPNEPSVPAIQSIEPFVPVVGR